MNHRGLLLTMTEPRLAITGFRSARRCLGKPLVFKRWACEHAGAADPHPPAKALPMVASGTPLQLALLYRAYGA